MLEVLAERPTRARGSFIVPTVHAHIQSRQRALEVVPQPANSCTKTRSDFLLRCPESAASLRIGDLDDQGFGLKGACELGGALATLGDEDDEGIVSEVEIKALRHRKEIRGKLAHASHEGEDHGVGGGGPNAVGYKNQAVDVDADEIGLSAPELIGCSLEIGPRTESRKADDRLHPAFAAIEGIVITLVGDDRYTTPTALRARGAALPHALDPREAGVRVAKRDLWIIPPEAGDNARPNSGISTFERPRSSNLGDPVCHRGTEVERLPEVSLGKENDELVPTEANDCVAAREGSKLAPDTLEQHVSSLVTPTLVHQPQVVEVEKEKRASRPGTDSFGEDGPAVAAGEPILAVLGPCEPPNTPE